MKNFIYNINQYLLKNYPTIWNTRIVWVLSVALVLHTIFYLVGFVSLMNPSSLVDNDSRSMYVENSFIFFGIICTILLMVVWLMFVFKNNAFKNFYPFSRNQLYAQFLIFIIGFFAISTFQISYDFGVKTYISIKYKDSVVEKQRSIIRKANPFFSHGMSYYTINNRKFPESFTKLHSYSDNNDINLAKPYVSFGDLNFQFYTYKPVYSYKKNVKGYACKKHITDSLYLYYFKDKVVDVKPYIHSTEPSYYNYSLHEISDRVTSYSYSVDYYNPDGDCFMKEKEQRNKEVFELLNRNNPTEIRGILSDYMQLARYYKANSNMNSDIWFSLIYFPKEKFPLKNIISIHKEELFPVAEPDYNNELDSIAYSVEDTFYTKHLSDYYLETDKVDSAIENIQYIKDNEIINSFWFYFYLFASLVFSMLVIIFRTSGLVTLLLTLVSIGLLFIVFALSSVFVDYVSSSKIFGMISIFFISVFLVVLSFTNFTRNKVVKSILNSLVFLGFPLIVLLLFAIMDSIQYSSCRYNNLNNFKFEICNKWLDSDVYEYSVLPVLFLLYLVFVYFYMKHIRHWKALPEN